VALVAKSRVIKASPKSDMAIIWFDIWDSQNESKAKLLINYSFNFGRSIATIRATNMNPGVPQCHNCWKWGHSTFLCCAHDSKCQKCNGPHKLEHHRNLACVTNFIWPYLHQFFDNSHSLNGSQKPLKRPFD